jgi:hypothetical protein
MTVFDGRLLCVFMLMSALWNDLRAEPYLAVDKGMQCSACHTQPSGGGKRTVYGNAYAQTELSAQRIGAADAALWTGEVSGWLAAGANVRAAYQYEDVPNDEVRSEFSVQRGTLYLEASLIPNRLSLYVDQQFAPGASLNRESYLRLRDSSGKLQLLAGQFFLPFGLRFQDDGTFVRQFTATNFTNPDRGLQVSYESGPWSSQLSLTNGSGGGTETDTGKQLSWVGQYVQPAWRAGASINVNDADGGDRQMQNVFAGLRTGPVSWLAEIDLISDDLAGGGKQDAIAGYIEGNWRARKGHNIKLAYDYFDPDDNVDEDHFVRYSLLWEYSPMQFLQLRTGARMYDGVPGNNFQNRDEFFLELHGFL